MQKIVSISNSLAQSVNGNYFVGQTPKLQVSHKKAFGALYNPSHSHVDFYVNVFTISNFSKSPLLARIWLGAQPVMSGIRSKQIANTNRTISKDKISPIQLLYRENNGAIKCGVNVFDRVIPAYSTIVAEEDGKYIIPPKQFFIITLSPLDSGVAQAGIAYGWWIKPTDKSRK